MITRTVNLNPAYSFTLYFQTPICSFKTLIMKVALCALVFLSLTAFMPVNNNTLPKKAKQTPECFSMVLANPGSVPLTMSYRLCDGTPQTLQIPPGDTVTTVCLDMYGGPQFDGPATYIDLISCM